MDVEQCCSFLFKQGYSAWSNIRLGMPKENEYWLYWGSEVWNYLSASYLGKGTTGLAFEVFFFNILFVFKSLDFKRKVKPVVQKTIFLLCVCITPVS